MVDKKREVNSSTIRKILTVLIIGFSLFFSLYFILANPDTTDAAPTYITVNQSGDGQFLGHIYNFTVNHSYTGGKTNVSSINISLWGNFKYSNNSYAITSGSNGTGNLTATSVAFFNVTYTAEGYQVLQWNSSAVASLINCSIVPGVESKNSSWFWFNATPVKAGLYNITIRFAYNKTALYQEVNISVKVNDTLAPNVSASDLYISDSQDTSANVIIKNGNYSGTLILNATGIDNVNITVVMFNLSNGSGYSNHSWLFYAKNMSTSPIYWNTTLNTKIFPDGQNYTIHAYVNDSDGNLNDTAFIANFTIDNTAPSGAMTCTPSKVNVGETVTCTCTSSDSLSGMNTTYIGSSTNNYDATPLTSSTGTFTTSCSFEDKAGNPGVAYGTYTVEMTGGGGGGGGSGTNPIIPVVPPVTKSETWAEISPGTSAIMSGFETSTAVDHIQIDVTEKATNVQVSVSAYESKPAAVATAKSNTYKYLAVSSKNLEDKLAKAVMRVQVEKSWINTSGISKDDIAVYSLNNDTKQWDELTTTYREESGLYYYYEVELSHFSYFAIASKKALVAPPEEEPTGIIEFFKNIPLWAWIVAGVVIVAVIVGGGVAAGKKKRR